ncbi:J domain-containing protein [Paludibaculum fermentans]|uniref:J domain-containing protein n=1 Tax=Paludibaculum fermentans TaxID=1473598 RepID=UPI003EC0E667
MPSSKRDPFEVLGIHRDATREEIREKYRLLVRVCHPDRFDRTAQSAEWEMANELLRDLNSAYQALVEACPSANREENERNSAGTPRSRDRHPSSSSERSSPGTASKSTYSSAGGASDGNAASPHEERHAAKTYHGAALNWKTLSPTVQIYLDRLQKNVNPEPAWFYPSIAPGSLAFRFATGVCALAATAFWITEGDYDGTWVLIITFLFIGLYHLLRAVIQLTFILKGPMKPGLYVTPRSILVACGNTIWAWPIWSVESMSRKDGDYAGLFDYTDATFKFSEISHRIRIYNHRHFMDLQQLYSSAIARAHAEAQKGNDSYFHEDHILSLVLDTKSKSGPKHFRRSKMRRSLWLALASSVISACVIWPGLRLQDYYIDTRQWTSARAFDSAQSMRGYLKKRPNGRYSSNAQDRLDQIYAQTAARFSRSNTRLAQDSNARALIIAMLSFAHRTGQYDVGIYFKGENQLPSNLEQSIGQKFNVDHILDLGDAFSDQNMRARESAIGAELITTFSSVIPNGVLDFHLSPDQLPPMWLAVDYTVLPSDALYYNTKERGLPERVRAYYPGILFRWRIEMCAGHNSDQYAFEISSNPAQHITVDGTGASSASAVYRAMSLSAFTSLREEITRRVGLPIVVGDQRGNPPAAGANR